MFKWIKNLIAKIKHELAYRKRIKELKKKDQEQIYKLDCETRNSKKLLTESSVI